MLHPQVIEKVRNIVLSSGVDIVEEHIKDHNGVLSIRFLVDFPFGGIDLGTCERINRQISDFLESVSDLVPDYTVEVSSPGLDRKLRDYDDFKRVRGREVEVFLKEKVAGKGQWTGRVEEVSEEAIVIAVPKGKGEVRIEIPYDKMVYGRMKL